MYVLDNIDWEEKAHDMRQDVQNKSVHAVATSVVFNRVPDQGLPGSRPQQDLNRCNVQELVKLSDQDLKVIRSRYRILISRLLFKHFKAFEMLKQYMPQVTSCLFASEMATKSEVLTMLVLMKDEEVFRMCGCFGPIRKVDK